MKWNDLYKNEQELIKAMMKAETNPYKPNWVKGYEYVKSFQEYYKKNGCLTDKQMTQLKRLASEIYEKQRER